MPYWRPGRRKAGARLDTRLPAAVLVYILVVTDAAADGEGEGEGDWPIFSKVQRDPKGELSVSSFRVFQSLPIM